MNLRGIANSAIQSVNPNIDATWRKSTGWTTDAAGKRTATFSDNPIEVQVQALSAGDLKHVDALNMSGIMRSVYMYGNALSVARPDNRGGDLLIFPERPDEADKVWLVTSVVETWPDWAHVIVTLQVTPA